MKSWTIHTGDAFEFLAGLSGGSADHIITDLPYDERTHAGSRSQGETESKIHFPPLDPTQIPGLVAELLDVARRWVIVFCSLEMLGAYRDAAGKAWIRAGVWVRHSGPQYTGDRPGQGAEGIAIMHRLGRKRWNRGGGSGVWHLPVERKDRVHCCQKPLALMRALIEDFTDPGDLILDPYMGSGSTGVACVQLGRDFTGVELDPRYATIARERLTAAQEGQSLTAHRAGQTTLMGLLS